MSKETFTLADFECVDCGNMQLLRINENVMEKYDVFSKYMCLPCDKCKKTIDHKIVSWWSERHEDEDVNYYGKSRKVKDIKDTTRLALESRLISLKERVENYASKIEYAENAMIEIRSFLEEN